jgi:hypothetical protein
MSENYTPPFTMTEEITNLVIEIGELVGAVATYVGRRRMLINHPSHPNTPRYHPNKY